MSTIEHTSGGASISVRIRPISKTTPVRPGLAGDIADFLSIQEKASFCGKDLEFSRCLASFLEEIDTYLDDGRMAEEPMDPEIIGEMEDFMNEHLPVSVRKNLKKLDEE